MILSIHLHVHVQISTLELKMKTSCKLLIISALSLFAALPNALANLEELFTPEEVASSVTLPEVDQQPKPVNQVEPDLSGDLKRLTGFAKVAFIINADGKVESPRIQSSSDSRFEAPTLAAIGQWEFKPAEKGGSPVAVRVVLPFRYTGK
jgi:TonB family protein